jgi:hypothetical protein
MGWKVRGSIFDKVKRIVASGRTSRQFFGQIQHTFQWVWGLAPGSTAAAAGI